MQADLAGGARAPIARATSARRRRWRWPQPVADAYRKVALVEPLARS